jgi:hypothetical protein
MSGLVKDLTERVLFTYREVTYTEYKNIELG